MNKLIENLENKAMQWGAKRWLLNTLRHWHTTLVGLIVCVHSLLTTLHFLDAIWQNPDVLTIEHVNALLVGWGVGIGMIMAKDAGAHDVQYDDQGNPIPQAEVVK